LQAHDHYGVAAYLVALSVRLRPFEMLLLAASCRESGAGIIMASTVRDVYPEGRRWRWS
jgi:hypothetical protein